MNGSFWNVNRDRMEEIYGIGHSSEDCLDQHHVEDGPGPDAEEYIPLPQMEDDDRHSCDELGNAVGVCQDRGGPQAVDYQHAYYRRG